MRFRELAIDGPLLIELDLHTDDRGAFARTFCVDEFASAGLPTAFPQCNLSINDARGTLRGMHFNASPHCEAKVVRCVRGAIFDVVVDLRHGSPTQFRHVSAELTATNRLSLYIPAGFAHGFVTLEDATDVHYHMGARYVPDAARGLRWNDPTLGITWPIAPTIMSRVDAAYGDVNPATFDLAD